MKRPSWQLEGEDADYRFSLANGRYWMHLRRVMGAVHRWANQRSTLWDEHLAIAQAINAGDADRATLLTEQHIQRAKDNLVIQLRDKLSKEGIDKAA